MPFIWNRRVAREVVTTQETPQAVVLPVIVNSYQPPTRELLPGEYPTVPTPLCEIMGRNRSDKGHLDIANSQHNYTTVYYELFKSIKDNHMRVFELGLGTNNVNFHSNMGINGRPGASLYGWAEFFKNATIFGADIDDDILFQTDKIKTFFCDQTNPQAIKTLWDMPELKDGFDIIVEDGLHIFSANVCFFENSIHKLNPNGFYIIEDIHDYYVPQFVEKISEWKIKYSHLTFDLLDIHQRLHRGDNRILVIQNRIAAGVCERAYSKSKPLENVLEETVAQTLSESDLNTHTEIDSDKNAEQTE